jgi:eukaryotic-like serine/threonine-protein kinase
MGEQVRTVSPLHGTDPPKLGNHTLIGRLGAGGMGVVYLAEGPSGLVAIKVVRDELSNSPDFRVRFQREVRACFLVSGPWTARLVDFDVTANPPWLATEFIDAPDLQEFVETNGPFSAAAQVDLAFDLARGLASLHAHTLVHRDLKPSNVLHPPEGPKIIDFGIASAVEDIGSLTATDNVVGSPAWMSPEQILDGESGMPSDVYAWGALVAFSATGRPLVSGRNIHQIMSNALTLDVQASVDQVGGPLRPVVAAALSADPNDRPTAAQLVQTLSPLRDDPPPPTRDRTVTVTRPIVGPSPADDGASEPETSPGHGPQRSGWKTHKGGLVAAGLAGVLLLGGVTVVLVSLSGSSKPNKRATSSGDVRVSAPATNGAVASSTGTPTPTIAASTPAIPETAVADPFRPILSYPELLNRIPASLRPTCTKVAPNAPSTSQASCRFDDPDGSSNNVNYSGFKTAAELSAGVGAEDKVADGCVKGLSTFINAHRDGGYQHTYVDGKHYGLVDCQFVFMGSTASSYSNISWTDNYLSLGGFMSNQLGTEAAYENLYQQWLLARHAS